MHIDLSNLQANVGGLYAAAVMECWPTICFRMGHASGS